MAVSFNKEFILEAIQEVLAEAETVKKVIGPKGGSIAQAISPEEEKELKKAGAKIEPMEEDHHENPNDDSDMAKSQLYAIAKYAIELLQMIKDGDPLDAWVQAKITKASDYIDAVQHYLEGEEYLDANQEESEEELDEGIGTIALGVAGGLALLKALKFIGGKVLKGIAHNVPLPKEKLLEVVSLAIKKSMQDGSSGINMFKIIGLKKFLEEKIEDGSITTIKQIKQVVEKAAKLDDSDLNDAAELDEIKKAEFEKIKPGKELQLRGYGVVKVIDNDGIVMKIKDSLDKVHTINLGQYNEKFLKEARKRGEKTVRTELDATIAKMKELAKKYKEGDKSVVPTLKDLTTRKKALSAELEKIVAGIGAGQEYKGEVDESLTENKATCCGKCGRTHVKGTECKKPFLTGKDHCRVR